ncbi:hypothetical protein MOQ72_16090 [Saccharopolyspora sp. K220]|uniref:hypothetical protein n=1 Tax=Saccharopolyspora soli TaxID=2926618 RepID=UPI001F588C83|nr:hypothetical protein [Saccharopolyspora soli]MCI2418965.1 hypothetical protein [Saccharopolyspora soli]
MSRHERRTGAARQWRLLTRALVVAGATVAGTSAAWLIGTAGPASAADLPSAADASDDSAAQPHADEQTTDRTDPAEFSLRRLDPVALVRSGPAGQLLDAARPMTGVLRDSTAEVRHVADNALSVTGSQASTLSASVDSGLEELGQPLLAGETGVRPATMPPALQAPMPSAPFTVPVVSQLIEPHFSDDQSESVSWGRAPRPAESPGLPARSTPFHLPAPPGSPGCGGTGDGQQHNNSALGWYPVEPDGVPVLAGAPACDIARALLGLPEPQPGTTPD